LKRKDFSLLFLFSNNFLSGFFVVKIIDEASSSNESGEQPDQLPFCNVTQLAVVHLS
jgi:hypothetical protein